MTAARVIFLVLLAVIAAQGARIKIAEGPTPSVGRTSTPWGPLSPGITPSRTPSSTPFYTRSPQPATPSSTRAASSTPSPFWFTASNTPSISRSRTPSATRTFNFTTSSSPTRSFSKTSTPSRTPTPSRTKGQGFPACSALPVQGLRRGYNLTVIGSNVGAPVYSDECQQYWSPTVWYSLTPEADANVTITTCNSYTNFDTILTLRSGLCSELLCVTSNDDACSQGGSTITWTAAPATTYWISVSGYNSQAGNFELILSTTGSVDPTCYSAIDLPGPYFSPVVISGSNVGFVPSQMQTCGLSASDRAVWYLISPAPGSPMVVTTCSAYTDFDTSLALYEGTCNSLRCVAFNDNNCTRTNGHASTIEFTPTSSSYYVVVSGAHAAMGYYQLYMQQERIVGFGCQSPYNIALGTSNFQIIGSTVNSGNLTAPICHTEMGQAYWYYVSVSHTSEITIATCSPSTNFDTYLSVYSGSCSSLSCVGYNDDACDGTKSQLTINRNPGETFFIVVSGKGGAVGSFVLSFTLVVNN